MKTLSTEMATLQKRSADLWKHGHQERDAWWRLTELMDQHTALVGIVARLVERAGGRPAFLVDMETGATEPMAEPIPLGTMMDYRQLAADVRHNLDELGERDPRRQRPDVIAMLALLDKLEANDPGDSPRPTVERDQGAHGFVPVPFAGSRSDAEIVEQANDLALRIARDCFSLKTNVPGYRTYASRDPRMLNAWLAACIAFEVLQGTPADEALSNLEEDAPAKMPEDVKLGSPDTVTSCAVCLKHHVPGSPCKDTRKPGDFQSETHGIQAVKRFYRNRKG